MESVVDILGASGSSTSFERRTGAQGAQGGEPTDRSPTDGVEWAAGRRLTQISTDTATSIWFSTSAYRSTSTSGALMLTNPRRSAGADSFERR